MLNLEWNRLTNKKQCNFCKTSLKNGWQIKKFYQKVKQKMNFILPAFSWLNFLKRVKQKQQQQVHLILVMRLLKMASKKKLRQN